MADVFDEEPGVRRARSTIGAVWFPANIAVEIECILGKSAE